MMCPICKRSHMQNKNWVKCPKLNNALICDKHCEKCSSFSGDKKDVFFCKFGRKLA